MSKEVGKSDPMWDWDSWSRNRGEFSTLSDWAFERHLKNLYEKKQMRDGQGMDFVSIEPLWY